MCASSSTTKTLDFTGAGMRSIDHDSVSQMSPGHDGNVKVAPRLRAQPCRTTSLAPTNLPSSETARLIDGVIFSPGSRVTLLTIRRRLARSNRESTVPARRAPARTGIAEEPLFRLAAG